MDDLEVRQALDVIRERMDTKKAEEAAAEAMAAAVAEAAAAAAEAYEEGGDWKDAFLATWNAADDDDNERLSQTSTQRRAAAAAEAEGGGDEKPEWDGSTSMGEGGRKKLAAAALAAAKELREMNPKLAEKHSNKSLAQAIETAQKAELAEEFGGFRPSSSSRSTRTRASQRATPSTRRTCPTFTGTRLSSLGKEREKRAAELQTMK